MRVGNKAIKPSPSRIVSHKVSNPICSITVTIIAAIQIRIKLLGRLYSSSPYIIPAANAVAVKPRKGAAIPKSDTPTKSAIAAPMPAKIGPYIMAIITIGINPKLILMAGSWIESKRVKIISSAINIAVITSDFVVNLGMV